jgi:D-alanyl-D-alanine carboxypeptidase/D-alanyl-D-alanine-endopeptidase (penicillin-binding protein 4)
MHIDANALDNKVWGEGWQWDDDMNVLMPRFNSYNLDKNLIKLTIVPTEETPFAMILNPSKYPLVFFNNVVKGDKTALDIHRDSIISANTLVLSGTVARATTVYIPTADLKRYFNVQLTRILEDKNLYFKHSITESNITDSDVLIDKTTHPISQAVSDVLKNSNNLVSETMFKLAGAKHCNLKTGTDSAGIKMFNDYCVKNKLDNSRIRITDASGVSKNNLVSADFVSEFLLVNKDNKIMECLPTPGEGTLTNRLLPIKNNLKAKTGTLSDISSIAGY